MYLPIVYVSARGKKDAYTQKFSQHDRRTDELIIIKTQFDANRDRSSGGGTRGEEGYILLYASSHAGE